MFIKQLILIGISFHVAQPRPQTGINFQESDDGSYLMETDDALFGTDSSIVFHSDSKKFDNYDPSYTEKGHKPGKLIKY